MADPLLSDGYLQLELALYRLLGFYYDAVSRLWRARASGDSQQAQHTALAVRVTAADAQSAIGAARRYLQQLPQSGEIAREIEHLGIFEQATIVQLKHLPPDQGGVL